MHEEIEARRYYVEMPDAKIASICVLLSETAGFSADPDFTVILGLKEDASDAAHKATAIDELLQPAEAAKHGAKIGDGMAVITLSYRCTSIHNDRAHPSARTMPPAFILGLLTAADYIPMHHYERIMAHVKSMDDMRLGGMSGKAPVAMPAMAWH